MGSNGTPTGWRKDRDWRYGAPTRLRVSERPPLDVDPRTPDDSWFEDDDTPEAGNALVGYLVASVIIVAFVVWVVWLR